MSKERQTAEQILLLIGGQENILNVEHCATRLRLVLKDETKFNKKEIEAIDGVKGSFLASGQHQIILGTGFVNKVYAEVMDITKMDSGNMMSKSDAAAVHMNVFPEGIQAAWRCISAYYTDFSGNRSFYGPSQPDY